MKTFSFCLSFLFFVQISFARETDNLTGRYKKLEDSTEVLDKEMNRRLQELAEEATSKKIACDNPRALRILFYDMNKESITQIGSMESWAEDSKNVSKRKATPDGSVYSGVLSNSWLFGKIDLASTIKVNGELIGTDKLGHFIDQGFQRYTYYRQRNYNMDVALDGSLGSERSTYGAATTGVISYADSMANYHGILFIHALVEGSQPYFRCSGGVWTQSRSFTFRDYVDAGWDEGVNCSVIAGKEAQAAYEKNLQKLEADSQARGRSDNFRCPADMASCGKLRSRYAAYEKHLLSPGCRKASPAKAGSGGNSSFGQGVR